MAKIKTIEAMVRDALVHDAKARDDDRILTLDVWVNCYKVNPCEPIKEVMRDKHLPSQETIGRARRKIQETIRVFLKTITVTLTTLLKRY